MREVTKYVVIGTSASMAVASGGYMIAEGIYNMATDNLGMDTEWLGPLEFGVGCGILSLSSTISGLRRYTREHRLEDPPEER